MRPTRITRKYVYNKYFSSTIPFRFLVEVSFGKQLGSDISSGSMAAIWPLWFPL